MKTVLDAFALLALLKDQRGADGVATAITEGEAVMSWINLGEVHYTVTREVSATRAAEVVEVASRELTLELPDAALVIAAAEAKAAGRISYADCFCVATAERHAAPLLTGDPEILGLRRAGLQVVDLRG